MFNHTLHVIFTDVLSTYFEARTMLECTIKIMWAHYFIMLIDVATIWNVFVHVFNNYRV